MRVVTWNCSRAGRKSTVWNYLMQLNPDVAVLQEVTAIPESVTSRFASKAVLSTNKSGVPQSFGTAILVKGKVESTVPLRSSIDWINSELLRFPGNLLTCDVATGDGRQLRITSVHSPAWPVDSKIVQSHDVSKVRLTQNKDVWVADLLWASMGEMLKTTDLPWVVAGDFNLSETFDSLPAGPRGNLEYLQRMEAIGFVECLRKANGKLVPTYLNKDKKGLVHQIDHMFVNQRLASSLSSSTVGSETEVLHKGLSDHLPIVSDFTSPAES